MRETDVSRLVCPECRGDLRVASVAEARAGMLETAEIRCARCNGAYPVRRGVPRFVPGEGYAASFGVQWKRHAATQVDSRSGLRVSEERFFAETRWPRDLSGETVLEVGGGAGRFTEQAASTGAFVVSIDSSGAVDVNHETNGAKPNVLVVQADLYRMPLRPGSFDKVFCFGVLQHTPDVRRAFFALPAMLKPGGELVVDVYKKTLAATVLSTKYYARLLTRRMDPERLERLTRAWVDLMWPLARVIGRLPRIGRSLNWRLLVADHSELGLDGKSLKEWAYLDTFDMLAPRYDRPQRLATVRRWFDDAGLVEVEVGYGYNGIEGRGRRPCAASRA